MKRKMIGSLCLLGVLVSVRLASAQNYYYPYGNANTTPAVRWSNPYTAPTIYNSGAALGYGAYAGASLYDRNWGGAISGLRGLYNSTGNAYFSNQQRQGYVYPPSPWARPSYMGQRQTQMIRRR